MGTKCAFIIIIIIIIFCTDAFCLAAATETLVGPICIIEAPITQSTKLTLDAFCN